MAKMFYTIEETCEKLGLSEEEVRQLSSDGKLQQFRDRDKLMFKRDQVDAFAAERSAEAEMDATDELDLADLDSGVDQIDLSEEPAPAPSGDKSQDSRMRTGISVFDADEIEMADPLAQTVVTEGGDDDDLVLESVGSGSGLLDLTRESDDTSLGAELLDEIYPGSGEGSDIALDLPSSSGSFDSPVAIEPSGTGLDNLQPLGAAPVAMAPAQPPTIVVEQDPWDPAGSAMTVGFLFPAAIGAVLCLMVMVGVVIGIPDTLVDQLTREKNYPIYILAGLLVFALLLGLAGFFIGKSRYMKVQRQQSY